MLYIIAPGQLANAMAAIEFIRLGYCPVLLEVEKTDVGGYINRTLKFRLPPRIENYGIEPRAYKEVELELLRCYGTLINEP